MRKVDNNFLDVMSLDAIRLKVNACHPGSFHSILMLDGAPISITPTETLYIVETLSVVFKVNYYNRSYKKLEAQINDAETVEEVNKVKSLYDNFKHKDLILKSAVATLVKKVQAVKAGAPIPKTVAVAKTNTKVRDNICSSIVYNQNGSITLSALPSFQNTIKSVKGGFEFKEKSSHKRFFLKIQGDVYELDYEEYKPFESVAVAEARASAKKKDNGPAPFYGPKVTNIIKII